MTLLQLPEISQIANVQGVNLTRAGEICLTADGSAMEPGRDAAFWLAMEEWAARKRSDECFFTWQVSPTAIYGRNQMPQAEINMAYCSANNIGLMRRRSGGGCIFADGGNVMFSYVCNTVDDIPATFARITAFTVDTIRSLGIPAYASGRNDIMLEGGGKVCGYAVYDVKDGGVRRRTIVHGTTLVSLQSEHMQHVLTPNKAKLERHGVESVRQRVDVLTSRRHDLTVAMLVDAANARCNQTYTLSGDDIAEIETIARRYRNPQWVIDGITTHPN